MQIVEICELFGWDYQTYLDQPIWFIQTIIDKMEIDNEKIKKLKRKK